MEQVAGTKNHSIPLTISIHCSDHTHSNDIPISQPFFSYFLENKSNKTEHSNRKMKRSEKQKTPIERVKSKAFEKETDFALDIIFGENETSATLHSIAKRNKQTNEKENTMKTKCEKKKGQRIIST